MLRIENLKVSYGKVEVIHGITLNVAEGKITSIIGSNGAGKSTLMKTIMHLVSASSGHVFFKEKPIDKCQTNEIVHMGIALCPEGRQLFPKMTVRENLLMGAFLRKDNDEIAQDIDHVVDWFPILKKRMGQIAGTLSGGEQEMLAIARTLMTKPKLILFDEPTWGLSPKIVIEVLEIIKEINKQGTTVLLVEQNAEMALEIADYVYAFETGHIVVEGIGKQLMENDQIRKAYLGV